MRALGLPQDGRGAGIPSRRRACLGAGLGWGSSWSTQRAERAGPPPQTCYASGADATEYRSVLGQEFPDLLSGGVSLSGAPTAPATPRASVLVFGSSHGAT